MTFKFHFEAKDLKNYGACSNKRSEGFEGSTFMHSGYFIFPHSKAAGRRKGCVPIVREK